MTYDCEKIVMLLHLNGYLRDTYKKIYKWKYKKKSCHDEIFKKRKLQNIVMLLNLKAFWAYDPYVSQKKSTFRKKIEKEGLLFEKQLV